MSKFEKIRIIPKLEIKNEFLIKGLQFEGLAKLGNPIEFAKKYYADGADQIYIQDIVASLYSRDNLFEVVNEISKNIFIPITVGGGIKDINDIKNLLKSGADRISVNTKAINNPDFIGKINNIFGNQFLTISIEVRNIDGYFYCMMNHGRDNSNFQLKDWLEILDKFNIGEVMITSIDNDGSCNGFDRNLINEIKKFNYNFPIVYGGGLNSEKDIDELLLNYNFSGVNIAAALHDDQLKISKLKSHLIAKGHNINNI